MADVVPITRARTYRVRSIHDTFQGEGAYSGARAAFVRLSGCNLWDGVDAHRSRGAGACAAWCDTEFVGGKSFTAAEILGMLDQAWPPEGVRRVVLTGGEPLLQVDAALVDALHEAGWVVHVETNGTVQAPPGIDWLTCSPKLPAAGRDDGPQAYWTLESCDELKVVLPGHLDHDWHDEDLLQLAERLRPRALYVQPLDPQALRPKLLSPGGRLVDARSQKLAQAFARCSRFVRAHPEWRLGVQMQKVAGIP